MGPGISRGVLLKDYIGNSGDPTQCRGCSRITEEMLGILCNIEA